MSIYGHPAGEGADIVWLERWSIREFADGARHFVGYSRETRDGRVSTKIIQLDCAARTARTSSGRIYQLVGPSGYSGDSEYVFRRVAEVIGDGQPWHDATTDLIPNACDTKHVTANREDVTLVAAACLLFVSCTYVRTLIAAEKLPSRVDADGVLWIPIVALMAYRARTRAEQKAGLETMVNESVRLGLYDTDDSDGPNRRTAGGDGKE
jgi:hypothetical protein